MAERGRLLEGAITELLREILPDRYTLGTGVIVNNNGDQSNQVDIIIYDAHSNIRLNVGEAAIFPVESVYAVIEIKSQLTSTALRQARESIARIRRMAQHKEYVEYRPKKLPRQNGIVTSVIKKQTVLAPRSFIIAFRASTKSQATIQSWLQDEREPDSMVHGLYVFEPDFFASQHAYTNPPKFNVDDSELAFFEFLKCFFHAVLSMPMGTANIERYLGQT